MTNLKRTLKHRLTIIWCSYPFLILVLFTPIHFLWPDELKSFAVNRFVGFSVTHCFTIIFVNYFLVIGKWQLEKWVKYLVILYIPNLIFLAHILTSIPDHWLIPLMILISGQLALLGTANFFITFLQFPVFAISFSLFLWLERPFIFWEDLSTNSYLITGVQIFWFMMAFMSSFIKDKDESIRKLLRTNRRDKRTIHEEREKSEALLLNILPSEIAKELKQDGLAKPRYYDSVSVMFTDFVGFTDIANQIKPNELVRELDNCFSYFDSVTQKYNLEKIKTIGDSYMTCAGIPNTNNTHQVDTVLAALEIQTFMLQTKEIKDTQGLPYWELRLGINTGPLVAGVIGEMKFAYDVFGDTVNTASRMESSGEKGKINISQSVYDSVKHFFECEHRGKVQAKRKGELDMYFVHGVKKEYSRNGEGRVPNKRFFRDYLRLKKYGTV